MLIECACCKKETEHQHLHNCAHGIPDLEKTHYETTYDRVQRLESQLAEARAEVRHLKMLRDIDRKALDEQLVEVERLNQNIVDTCTERLGDIEQARQEAARDILDSLTQEEIRRITSVGDPRVTTISSKLLAMMAELRQRYGLEG